MDLKKINLNIYSFGYSAGFIRSSKVNEETDFKVTLETVKSIVLKEGMGGVEFPFDFFFRDNLEAGLNFIRSCFDESLNVFLDFENFDTDYLSQTIPTLKELGFSQIRVKMDHLDPVFYGGNRFEQPGFSKSVDHFSAQIEKLLPTLKECGMRILIENHQDLSSEELVSLCEKFDSQYVGINWDIGNSLASGETIEQFYTRAKNYIGNAHLKDYRTALTEDGFRMVRCPVGRGTIEISRWVKEMISRDLSVSIELGAQISREAKTNHSEYFSGYLRAQDETNAFNSFIKEVSLPVGTKGTLFEESPESWREIVRLERDEVLESISFLKGL